MCKMYGQDVISLFRYILHLRWQVGLFHLAVFTLSFKILRIVSNSWEQVEQTFVQGLRIRQKGLFVRKQQRIFFSNGDAMSTSHNLTVETFCASHSLLISLNKAPLCLPSRIHWGLMTVVVAVPHCLLGGAPVPLPFAGVSWWRSVL